MIPETLHPEEHGEPCASENRSETPSNGRHHLAVIVACSAILAAIAAGCHALLGGVFGKGSEEVQP